MPVQDTDLAAQEARLQAKIVKLQTQQRRQRLMKDLEGPQRPPGGFRFIYAFLIVLGLHVAAVGGFFGYSMVKKHIAAQADRLALESKKPAYTGVPIASPSPAQTANSSKVADNQISKQVVSKSSKGAPKQSLAAKSKRHSPTEPSAKVRELFAKMHPSASAGSLSKGTLTETHSATEALTGMATQGAQYHAPLIHKVLPGESLAQIAKANGVKTSALRDANHLDQSDDLQVGQKLTIPAQESNPPLQLVDKSPESTSNENQIQKGGKDDAPETFTPRREQIAPNGVYTVQRGDNPYMVAHKLGVNFTDLMTANSITNPADVTIGMKLKVPSQQQLASN
jgi:LysM repeat protein